MRTMLSCTVAAMAALLAAVGSDAQVQPAPTVKMPVLPSTTLKPVPVQYPFMVDYSFPPGAGSFPASGVQTSPLPPASPPGRPAPPRKPRSLYITRTPDASSAMLRQLLNRTPANSLLTITAFHNGKAIEQLSYSNVHLKAMTTGKTEETLTFEFEAEKMIVLH